MRGDADARVTLKVGLRFGSISECQSVGFARILLVKLPHRIDVSPVNPGPVAAVLRRIVIARQPIASI
jgi:hypothetical protein